MDWIVGVHGDCGLDCWTGLMDWTDGLDSFVCAT